MNHRNGYAGAGVEIESTINIHRTKFTDALEIKMYLKLNGTGQAIL